MLAERRVTESKSILTRELRHEIRPRLKMTNLPFKAVVATSDASIACVPPTSATFSVSAFPMNRALRAFPAAGRDRSRRKDHRTRVAKARALPSLEAGCPRLSCETTLVAPEQ